MVDLKLIYVNNYIKCKWTKLSSKKNPKILLEWILKLTICCIQELYLNQKVRETLEMKGEKRSLTENINKKLATLIDSKAKKHDIRIYLLENIAIPF